MSTASSSDDISPSPKSALSEAVLTETVRHVDIIHTSLAGMTAIVLMLLGATALPVFGYAPVTHLMAWGVMVVAAFVGIGGLYILNFRVHRHVADQARLTEVLVNSLGQGFLVFDSTGVCGKVYSQACLELLETIPADRHIADVLGTPDEGRADFLEWLNVLFQPDHALGFDDVVKFLPQQFPHSQKRHVTLVYRPIYGKNGELFSVVLIATDQTEEQEAQQNALRQQAFAEMICRIFKERNQFRATLAHLRVFLNEAGTRTVGVKNSAALLRQLHTLKATVRHFNLVELAQILHEVENDLRGPEAEVDAEFRARLDAGRTRIAAALLTVTDEVSELLGGEHEWRGNVREIDEDSLYDFARMMHKRGIEPALIQHYLSAIAAVPVRDCFHSFERSLQELTSVVDKQIKPVKFSGSNPRVLTQSMQEFLFSLTHVARNIMDHGIEPPVTRMARGKDPAGQVIVETEIVSAESGDGKILRIVISDDGNGIDPSRVRAKLAASDPDGAWRLEDDQTVIQRIFSWGFSTSEKLTTMSGRGVGMEVVEQEVRKLGGTIRVTSELYKGASFDIRIPYCLDIATLTGPTPPDARAAV